jgi:hypothetical protein
MDGRAEVGDDASMAGSVIAAMDAEPVEACRTKSTPDAPDDADR